MKLGLSYLSSATKKTHLYQVLTDNKLHDMFNYPLLLIGLDVV